MDEGCLMQRLTFANGELISTEELPTPTAPRVMSSLMFIETKFSDAEQLAIATMAQTDPAVNLWLLKATSAQEIDLDDPRVSAGLDFLVYKELISEARATEILA
jgi:hypothetical protein